MTPDDSRAPSTVAWIFFSPGPYKQSLSTYPIWWPLPQTTFAQWSPTYHSLLHQITKENLQYEESNTILVSTLLEVPLDAQSRLIAVAILQCFANHCISAKRLLQLSGITSHPTYNLLTQTQSKLRLITVIPSASPIPLLTSKHHQSLSLWISQVWVVTYHALTLEQSIGQLRMTKEWTILSLYLVLYMHLLSCKW